MENFSGVTNEIEVGQKREYEAERARLMTALIGRDQRIQTFTSSLGCLELVIWGADMNSQARGRPLYLVEGSFAWSFANYLERIGPHLFPGKSWEQNVLTVATLATVPVFSLRNEDIDRAAAIVGIPVLDFKVFFYGFHISNMSGM